MDNNIIVFKTLTLDLNGAYARLTINRPEIRNAFDDLMISEFLQALERLSLHPAVRVLVVTGAGTAFSAGANIEWMKRMGEADVEANYKDASKVARLFAMIDELPIPVIARVNGPAMGGGVGLVAACDIAIAVDTAFFSFTEVKIGLVPAVIGPYVIRKIGSGLARELFLTGRKIDSNEAASSGLVNFLTTEENLDAGVEELCAQLLSSGPNALASAKRLVANVPSMTKSEYIEYTARLIADLRTSPEGLEGTAAFLERRKASWAAK